MQINCGTDIIEIERIKEAIEDLGENFINRVFTDNEIKYCESKKNGKYEHYAGRFAAKEAAFKAISKLLDDKYSINWKNIEIINDDTGRPKVNFIDIGTIKFEEIDVSISHCREYATANVIVSYN